MNKNKFYLGLSILIFSWGLAPFVSHAQNQTEIWGMTNEGGNSEGLIFKTDANGDNQEVMHMFLENPGKNPYANLCIASNGKFYGMTWLGGIRDKGLLFQYNPENNEYKKIVDFTGTANGSSPNGTLIETSGGELFGMTTNGGLNNMGVIFEFDPVSNTITKKYDFDGADHGSYPMGSLLEALNGKLYAMTSRGGMYDKGVLFEFDIATGTCEKKIDFDGVVLGSRPQGSLIQAANGKLYGTTYEGGSHDAGVFFEYDLDSCKKLHDFQWVNTGGNPMNGLIEAGDGRIYGTTGYGGVNDFGVFFEYDIAADTLIKKFDFDGTSSGRAPIGSLMQSADGDIWGMTVGGGANGAGIIYKYDIPGFIFNKKYDLNWTAGFNPRGGLVQTETGKLYGMTHSGGDFGFGTLFEFDTMTNVYATKLSLNGTVNGRNIYGSLVSDSSGNLYGMTMNGGLNNMGVLFKFDRAGNSYIKILDFDGVATGSYPRSSLLQATDGKFYGTTANGGLNDLGVLFEYDPINSIYTKKYDFSGYTNGSNPAGMLIQVTEKLYGVAVQGGNFDYGVIFEYDPATNEYTKKHDFNGAVTGGYPQKGMIQASNGKLYGMTYQGGTHNFGVLYEFDPANGIYTKKFDFNNTLGKNPMGNLAEAVNGKIYGMTKEGGAFGTGVLFEYDYFTDTLITKIDFNGSDNGRFPHGSLLQASNGKLYGMTSMGGLSDDGVLFEYDPVTNILIKKLDFDALNGKSPYYTELMEVCTYPVITLSPSNVEICPGENTLFHIASSGNSLTFQWQVDDGSGFTDIINDSVYSDVTNDTLRISGISSGMNAYQYRCVVTSACPAISIISDTAVLMVKPDYTYTESHAICNGQTYAWHGQSLVSEGNYYDNHLSIYGCDSSYTLTLTVNPVFTFSEDHEICEGEAFNWQDTTITTEGIYLASYKSFAGCDSIYTLNLTINKVDVSVTVNDAVITANAGEASYQWLDCNQEFAAIGGATMQNFTATETGNYAVMVIQGTCVDTSACTQINVVEITSFPDERLVIYPNPVSNELIIEMEGNNEKINFEILNAAGHLVYEGNFIEKTTVQTNHFISGIYLIKLECGEHYQLKKIVKE